MGQGSRRSRMCPYLHASAPSATVCVVCRCVCTGAGERVNREPRGSPRRAPSARRGLSAGSTRAASSADDIESLRAEVAALVSEKLSSP
jgi:hypothetical protein